MWIIYETSPKVYHLKDIIRQKDRGRTAKHCERHSVCSYGEAEKESSFDRKKGKWRYLEGSCPRENHGEHGKV